VGARSYSVDFPTLWIVPAWHERHCIIPDGFRKGTGWVHYDWQLWITVNHYRVKPDAVAFDDEGYPTRSAAFHNRRSQCVACQKVGKGPFAAVITCGEAVGPTLFAGWAEGGEVYRCEDHGCSCGWTYPYEPGEPMGMPWPTPLIQLLATSEDQVDNVYRPLQAMARGRTCPSRCWSARASSACRTTAGSTSSPRARCRGSATRSRSPAGRDAALHGPEQAHQGRGDDAPRCWLAWVAARWRRRTAGTRPSSRWRSGRSSPRLPTSSSSTRPRPPTFGTPSRRTARRSTGSTTRDHRTSTWRASRLRPRS
jgi:hypothetical protein